MSIKNRFKDKSGRDFPDWQEVKLSKILTEYNEKSVKGADYEHVSLTQEGVVPKTERFDRDFLVTTENKKYRITHVNDICYNPANLKFGVICRNKYKDAIFSPIYVTYRVNEGYLPEFVEYLVTRQSFIQEALRFQEGTVYERMAVSSSDFLNLRVKVPSIEEQKKIAEVLMTIDDRIAVQQEFISDLQKRKASFIQQIFSKDIRFKKADGSDFEDWKVVTLGDLLEFKNGLNADSKAFNNGDLKCIGVSDVYKCDPIVASNVKGTIQISAKQLEENIVEYGDMLFQRSSETFQDIGHASVYVDTEPVVFNGFVIRGKKIAEYNAFFMHYQMQSRNVRNQTVRLGAGAQHFNIGQQALASIEVELASTEEQERIADFFITIDEQIANEQAMLDDWKMLKNGMLQRLFV